jgi:nucleolar protein 53
MATAEAPPAQYKQSSRKGKKAWRKNVDVTQISTGLEEVRDQIIQGYSNSGRLPKPFTKICSGIIAERPSQELFAVDTTGSTDIQKAYNKRHKPLKVDEILAQRSAIPAVSSKKRLSDFSEEKRRKKARISTKEYDRLRQIAYGGDQVQKDVVETDNVADHDPWDLQEAKVGPEFSFLEKKRKKVEPVTLKQAPVSLLKSGKAVPAVRKPASGKSYNPQFNDWQDLVQREGDKAVEAEKRRLQEAKEEAERLERILAAADSETDGNESTWESEWEGFSENEEEEVKNKRPERKTTAQRNRIKRRKAVEGQAKHEKRMKAKEQQLQRIKELTKSVAEKEKARAELREMVPVPQDDTSSEDDGNEVLRKKRFGKHQYVTSTFRIPLCITSTYGVTVFLRQT